MSLFHSAPSPASRCYIYFSIPQLLSREIRSDCTRICGKVHYELSKINIQYTDTIIAMFPIIKSSVPGLQHGLALRSEDLCQCTVGRCLVLRTLDIWKVLSCHYLETKAAALLLKLVCSQTGLQPSQIRNKSSLNNSLEVSTIDLVARHVSTCDTSMEYITYGKWQWIFTFIQESALHCASRTIIEGMVFLLLTKKCLTICKLLSCTLLQS